MTGSSAFSGFRCTDCDAGFDRDRGGGPCEECGGAIQATYDLDAVSDRIDPGASHATESLLARTGLAALLPVAREDAVDIGQGDTPLVDAPDLAADLGVGSVAVKDEGSNPTGSGADREMATAVAVAAATGATTVAVPTMGNEGQAAAATAARAGLESQAFVPSRTPFVNKAMINVHGGEMRVVEGRYADALDAFREASAAEAWASLAPGDAPARVEGGKPVAYEIAAANGWAAPDWVVVPTGQVTGLLGIHRGFQDLVALDVIESSPRLVAAQAAGCDPLVAAHREGEDDPTAVDAPDSVCGELEIPDPAAGGLALAAIAESDGTAVAVQDDAILAGARTLAEAGVPGGVTGGAAMRAAAILAERGEIGREESVVLINPVSANKEADLMRSHLMSKGV